MSNGAAKDTIDVDDEEAKDVVASLRDIEKGGRKGRRAASDLVLMMNLPPEAEDHVKRRRQKSSSDVVARFQSANLADADLRFAEKIQTDGTYRERQESGIKEAMFVADVEHDEGVAVPDDFEFNHTGLTTQEAEKRLEQYGLNELPEKVDPKWLIFLRQLWGPMPILLWIAIIILAGIQSWPDMAILLFILFANAFISFYETNKAGDAIAALKNSLKPSATVKRDGKWQVIDASIVVPGDLVMLGSGSAIPADCRVNSGEIEVDQAALTGESHPVTFFKGDSCKMGSTVVRGEVEGTVEFTGINTFFGKTASLLSDTHERSHLQIMQMKIMMILVVMSLTCSLIVFAYLMANKETLEEALSYTVVIVVASIPLALEIVTNTTLAIGSKNLVKHGAIVAKLSSIEDLAGMSILCSDKTGTLTLNQMVLQDDTPMYQDGLDQATVLVYAAAAAKWKEPARDALDRLTLGSVDMDRMNNYEQTDFVPFDPTTKRTEGTVRDINTGETFKTSKGAPHIILGLLDPSAENTDVRDLVEKDVARLGEKGIRSLAVAKTDENGHWKMIGLLTFLDPPREDTKQTIKEARDLGVAVKMITGDHLLIARNTAEMLDLGDLIFDSEKLPLLDPETKAKPVDLGKNFGDLCLAADGFAQVFPEHKYLIVECLRELGYVCGMTGDGVNDAPALKRADVGIAVAGSTDAARAAADIVLTEAGLGTIIHGIVIAREIFQRMSNFITYRISATLQLLVFFFIAIFAFKPEEYEPEGEEWPEFFKMPVLMLMLITVLNDGTLITIAYDYAKANETPDKWNVPALFFVSSVMGAVSCFSSLLLVYFLLDSGNPNSLFANTGIGGVEYGEVITAVYLKISVSDFLTLFSARTGRLPFYKVYPAPVLGIGGVFALTISSILAIFWPGTSADGIPTVGLQVNMGVFGFVWIYCFIFFLIQDVCKILCYKYMLQTNFYGLATTGVVTYPESTKKLMKEMREALGSDKSENGAHH